jgi:hypothetical protein
MGTKRTVTAEPSVVGGRRIATISRGNRCARPFSTGTHTSFRVLRSNGPAAFKHSFVGA